MFRGEHLPSMPKEPPKVHKQNGVEVPYSPSEIAQRNMTYLAKKETWDKTMKVNQSR
jgi:hypothetical protein